MKTYTAAQLVRKFAGKYIDVYPHHHIHWNTKLIKFETVYEVRGTSKIIKENYNLPEVCVEN